MLLSVENLSFGFSTERSVLHNISLQSNQPETIAIVGASGCGKSTFLRVLCGILTGSNQQPLSGSITINGIAPKAFTEQGGTGFMFQDHRLSSIIALIEQISGKWPIE
jgi:ABC-type nitrate/sulfonate/bicarbonate transport system ATPase subunit